MVRANPELLLRALVNLLRNALRYGGENGTIAIRARRENERALIEIADQGPGLPPALLEKVFEPFFRLEDDRNRAGGGSGLGLAIVKTCVEACQGRVSARNRQPTGLVVSIELG